MKSQRWQETMNRLRAQNHCVVNLKAEHGMCKLHEIIDHPLSHQRGKLAELQQIRIDPPRGRLDDRH
jgi:uncharacterized membrane protein